MTNKYDLILTGYSDTSDTINNNLCDSILLLRDTKEKLAKISLNARNFGNNPAAYQEYKTDLINTLNALESFSNSLENSAI